MREREMKRAAVLAQVKSKAWTLEVDPNRWTVFGQVLFGRQALVVDADLSFDRASGYSMST